MNKILFFYDEASVDAVEIRNYILKNYAESHTLRIAAKKPGTTSYFLKHSVRKTPTVILLNSVDRELKRLENVSLADFKEFIKTTRK